MKWFEMHWNELLHAKMFHVVTMEDLSTEFGVNIEIEIDSLGHFNEKTTDLMNITISNDVSFVKRCCQSNHSFLVIVSMMEDSSLGVVVGQIIFSKNSSKHKTF